MMQDMIPDPDRNGYVMLLILLEDVRRAVMKSKEGERMNQLNASKSMMYIAWLTQITLYRSLLLSRRREMRYVALDFLRLPRDTILIIIFLNL